MPRESSDVVRETVYDGEFAYRPGKNEIEWVDSEPYLHVHYKPFGDWRHVIVRDTPENTGRRIEVDWRSGMKLHLSFKVKETKDKPTPHVVAVYQRHIMRPGD